MPKKPSKSATNLNVGYRRPPKQFRFKKGQTGNPAGINRKASESIARDLKAILERALNEKIELRQGDRAQFITTGAAGIRVLVEQFARGDHRARRDLIALLEKLGVDLMVGQVKATENANAEAISAHDEALLVEYVQHQIEIRLNGGADDALRETQSSGAAEPIRPEEKEQ